MADTTGIEWTGTGLRYVDQTKLPDNTVFVETADYRTVAQSITALEIRGAPAIGIAAAFAVVLAVSEDASEAEQAQQAAEAIADLSLTRPTAVNLFTSLHRMQACVAGTRPDMTLRDRLLQEATAIRDEDAAACRRIADFGVTLIRPGSSLLTHCHTGALATGGGGTALFIIIEAHRHGLVRRVYVDETRPLLQGARLTAWELLGHNVDAVLVTDSTAGFLMQQGKIDAILVGADRIATNGDVANKIGTYSLAVLAAHHGIPFYVAAPVSTIDFGRSSGADIPIEERDPAEVTHVRGMRIAAQGVSVYTPAFDVTPARFVSAIVTDAGILRPPYSESTDGIRSRLAGAAVAP
jgi:methylthioribose-1-phosphate isomerase